MLKVVFDVENEEDAKAIKKILDIAYKKEANESQEAEK